MDNSNEYKVSFYKNVRDTKGKILNLKTIIEDVKNGKYKTVINNLRAERIKKTRTKLKSNLPAFTVSGTFEPSKRKADLIKSHSGLIQIDFDDVKNLDDTLETLKFDKFTFIAFKSPSGTGIKLIVKIPPDKEKHLNIFYGLEEYYKKIFDLEIDQSCKDVSRLFFVSYDENLFINDESRVFTSELTMSVISKTDVYQKVKPILTNGKPSVNRYKTNSKNGANYINGVQAVTVNNIELYKGLQNDNQTLQSNITNGNNDLQIVINRILENKTDITQGYDNWLKIGFVLSNIFGESGRNIFHELSSLNSQYDFKDCDTQFTNCLKSKNTGVTDKTFFHIAKANGININVPNFKTPISEKRETKTSVKHINHYPKKDFEENGFWEDNGYYYTKGAKGSTKRISKCTIESLYLFKDGSNNANRLMKICNKQNGETILEIPAKDLTSVQSFKTALKSKGNYTFLGNGNDLENLTDVLCQKEVDAKKIQTLGTLKEFDCFAFSNGVIDSENNFRETDEYGVLKIKNDNIYIPASSSVNDENPDFISEKVFKYKKGSLDFKTWSNLFIKAYGSKGLIGTAFFVSALYRNVVFDYKGHYPFLFLFGERQTGKTTFAECLLYPFTVEPEKWAIALTNSTHKSLERKNSKAKNAIMYHKEYNKNTLDKHIIAYYKSAFDGSGGEKAQFTNDNKTHQTPVDSAFLIDGNYLPTQESALMDRMVILFFYKNYFTEETKKASNELTAKLKNGAGQIVKEVLEHKENVQKQFRNTFDSLYKELKKNSTISERTADNLASFGAPILSSNFLDVQQQKELVYELLQIGIQQEKNLHFVDETNRFWKSVKYYKETSNSDFLISNGLYFKENVFGLKLNLFYKLYVRYMEENKLNDSILEEMALKKQITQEKYLGLINKSKPIKIKGVLVRCALFEERILNDLED